MYNVRGVLVAAGLIGLTSLLLAIQPTKTYMEAVVSVEPPQALSLAPFSSIESTDLDGPGACPTTHPVRPAGSKRSRTIVI